jgi:hypothetical protein
MGRSFLASLRPAAGAAALLALLVSGLVTGVASAKPAYHVLKPAHPGVVHGGNPADFQMKVGKCIAGFTSSHPAENSYRCMSAAVKCGPRHTVMSPVYKTAHRRFEYQCVATPR